MQRKHQRLKENDVDFLLEIPLEQQVEKHWSRVVKGVGVKKEENIEEYTLQLITISNEQVWYTDNREVENSWTVSQKSRKSEDHSYLQSGRERFLHSIVSMSPRTLPLNCGWNITPQNVSSLETRLPSLCSPALSMMPDTQQMIVICLLNQ